jgi:acetaldehyde dehydrogenase/alcohol dehydrogenase
LIKAIDELKAKVNLPMTIKEFGVTEESFYATIDDMSEKAFDDQCTGANPRYPLISEMKQIYINVYDKPAAVRAAPGKNAKIEGSTSGK